MQALVNIDFFLIIFIILNHFADHLLFAVLMFVDKHPFFYYYYIDKMKCLNKKILVCFLLKVLVPLAYFLKYKR